MKILFLGPLKKSQKKIIKFLRKSGEKVIQKSSKLNINDKYLKNSEFIISYGYQHIINNKILKKFKNNTINLHISYLPWNRGAFPNLWSFLENTPSGVTIHIMDKGIDTGPIIFQKKVFHNKEGTLSTTYKNLEKNIENLFFKNWIKIKKQKYKKIKQNLKDGTSHKKKDKKKFDYLLVNGWNTKIKNLISKN